MVSFRHGVASADPLPDGVVLWTRCTTGAASPVGVGWWVSPTPSAAEAVERGTAEATEAADFTVHVDVRGLDPATTYWFGFTAGDATSPVGRTRTAPAPDGPAGRLRIGLTSCASWPCGFFNAYANMAARDLDLVVHVGDYIYENDEASHRRDSVRAHRPSGTVYTLDGYRARYAQYRTDPDLQALHASHPMVAVWDDHELAGDAWWDGAGAHDPRRYGPWEDRRAAAVQAYREWIPLRARMPGTVHRALSLGPLADLVMLDTRLVGRQRPAHAGRRAAVHLGYRGRSLLGGEQWRWLEGEVAGATGAARWLLLGNQVMMAPLPGLHYAGGIGVNPSQWDGYPDERERLYRVLRDRGWATNVAVLTGDLHSSWACDLPVGAEFVSPSVATDNFARTVLPPVPGLAEVTRRVLVQQNRHVRLADLLRHGYVVVDVTPEAVQADWWFVDTIARRDAAERWGGGWRLLDGELGLRQADAPASLSPAGRP